MALKRRPGVQAHRSLALAVPSYGAMALKREHIGYQAAGEVLAVPSYGAMALKQRAYNYARGAKATCSPLLRGDGPETGMPLPPYGNAGHLQSPPTGRWP